MSTRTPEPGRLMVANLGVPVVLCTAFGGEIGGVHEPLTAQEGA